MVPPLLEKKKSVIKAGPATINADKLPVIEKDLSLASKKSGKKEEINPLALKIGKHVY